MFLRQRLRDIEDFKREHLGYAGAWLLPACWALLESFFSIANDARLEVPEMECSSVNSSKV